MKITADHWLEGALRRPIPGGRAMPVRRFLVIHFTSGATAESSIEFWRTPAAKNASAHIVIDRDGTVYQCRPFNMTCGHAGVSRWQKFSNLNSCSIGIELANAGDNERLARRWSKFPTVEARHKNGGVLKQWEVYPVAQLAACEEVAKALVARYKLDDVVGHDDIAPSRKNDPGPAAEKWMGDLRMSCGFPREIKP